MKQYTAKLGGQRIYTAEDLVAVQNQILIAVERQYADLGDFILEGCQITGSSGNYAITSGLVYLDGKIRVFDAVSGVASLPKYIIPTRVDLDSREFKLGNTETVFEDYKTVLSDTQGSAYIEINTNAKNRYLDVILNSNRRFVTDSEKSTWNGKYALPSQSSGTFASGDGSWWVQKVGSFKLLQLKYSWDNNDLNEEVVIHTLPSSVKPNNAVLVEASCSSGGLYTLLIDTNGEVSVFKKKQAATYSSGHLRFSTVYN